MTREDFERRERQRPASAAALDDGLVIIAPCDCGTRICPGWRLAERPRAPETPR